MRRSRDVCKREKEDPEGPFGIDFCLRPFYDEGNF